MTLKTQPDILELFIKIDDKEFEKACAQIKQRQEDKLQNKPINEVDIRIELYDL